MSKFDHRFDEENWVQLAKMAEVGLCASAMVHEIRQPLSALKMALQLLREGEADDNSTCLDNALGQAERMEQLLVQMRSFLRPSFSKDKEQVDLGGIVKRVVQMLSMGLKSGDVEIRCDIQEGLPSVSVCPHRVEQIVFNLVGNAKDAVLESRGSRVLVSVSLAAGPSVRIVVADDGPGIDPNLRERVFEPFYTTKDESKGTGLGLFIVKQIAEQCDATVDLLDRKDLDEFELSEFNTAFEVMFAATVGKMTIPPPAPTEKSTNRVLIVHEDVVEASAVKALLSEDGMDCTAVTDSDEAVSMLEHDRFDLMVLDRDLTGITGLELSRLARNMNPLMWILLLFNRNDKHITDEVAGLKRTYCLFKPVDTDELSVMARDLLGIDLGESGDHERDTQTNPEPISIKDGAKNKDSFNGISVLLVEPRQGINFRIFGVLHDLGLNVVALDTFGQAKEYLENKPSDIIVASMEALLEEEGWLEKKLNDSSVRTAVAILDDKSVDKSIEAIHIGARGVFCPPFDEDNIAIELKRVITWLS